MRVCLGGTFDVLHAGHEALLSRAFELGDEEVLIGITSDGMARTTRKVVNPLSVRRRNLQAYLRRRKREARIEVIEDVAGPPAYEEDIDAIVVSADRQVAAREINAERKRRGHKPMDLVVVPMILAEDSLPIAARRIRAGEVDRQGRMRRPLRVVVGSTNRVKVAAARQAFAAVFRTAKVQGVVVDSKVPDQPFEEEVVAGAIARARAAIAKRPADYGVGIESGLFWNETAEEHLDVPYCAVVDKRGVVTVGHGPGFPCPPCVIGSVNRGKTVGEAVEALAGLEGLGGREGAVGWLSRGATDRARLTEDAVLMALVPRIRRELYFP